MDEPITVFEILRYFIVISSPLVFVGGILIILYSNYKRLEEFLAVEMIKAKIFVPKLENNHFNFHEWLMEKRTILGVICIIYSLSTFYILNSKLIIV